MVSPALEGARAPTTFNVRSLPLITKISIITAQNNQILTTWADLVGRIILVDSMKKNTRGATWTPTTIRDTVEKSCKSQVIVTLLKMAIHASPFAFLGYQKQNPNVTCSQG